MIRIIVVLCLLLLLSSCSRYHKVQATSSSPSDQSNRQFACQATTNKKQNESNTCSSSDTIDSDFHRMLLKIQTADGFFAALDQSGGSTPKALREYGIPDNSYIEGEESMYDAVHSMRTRIVTSKSFTGAKIIGAILFENTAFDRTIDGIPTPNYLWNQKGIVPFLKVDVGLEADILDGVQLMKPIPNLNALLHRAKKAGIFGTKMRSVIKHANEKGIRAIAEQQFTLGKQIIQSGLIPILEPEVDIHSTDKVQCEEMLKSCLLEQLATLTKMDKIILKLSIPTVSNYYLDLIEQYPDQVICIVALSGGYPRAVANELLSQQRRMIASFSRALTENLQYSITDNEFDERLQDTIDSIYQASKAG